MMKIPLQFAKLKCNYLCLGSWINDVLIKMSLYEVISFNIMPQYEAILKYFELSTMYSILIEYLNTHLLKLHGEYLL